MKLKILGSGSKGNCYLLDNGRECLVIEAGIPFKEVQKAVDYDLSRIVGVLISHEHGDHAKYVQKFLDARIPCYMSKGTAEALGIADNPLVNTMADPVALPSVGKMFVVDPFPTQHDAAEPFGFLIYHHEMGLMLFATDTYYLKYKFFGLNNILIECNYSIEILNKNVEEGRIPLPQRNRTIRSHMSYGTCLETLQANDLSEVNNIVLIHLSDGNSNAKEFADGIREATGKSVHVAEKGMELEFNKTPF